MLLSQNWLLLIFFIIGFLTMEAIVWEYADWLSGKKKKIEEYT
jgi:hypothetical protein